MIAEIIIMSLFSIGSLFLVCYLFAFYADRLEVYIMVPTWILSYFALVAINILLWGLIK